MACSSYGTTPSFGAGDAREEEEEQEEEEEEEEEKEEENDETDAIVRGGFFWFSKIER